MACEVYDKPMEAAYCRLMDLEQELTKTKQALDVAVNALKKYKGDSGNWWYGYEFQGHYENYAGEYADKALDQIKQITKSAENVQTDTKSRPVNVQKKMTPEELDELKLLVEATFK